MAKRQRCQLTPTVEDDEACDELELEFDESGRIAGAGAGLDFSTRAGPLFSANEAAALRLDAQKLHSLDHGADLDASFWWVMIIIECMEKRASLFTSTSHLFLCCASIINAFIKYGDYINFPYQQ